MSTARSALPRSIRDWVSRRMVGPPPRTALAARYGRSGSEPEPSTDTTVAGSPAPRVTDRIQAVAPLLLTHFFPGKKVQ